MEVTAAVGRGSNVSSRVRVHRRREPTGHRGRKDDQFAVADAASWDLASTMDARVLSHETTKGGASRGVQKEHRQAIPLNRWCSLELFPCRWRECGSRRSIFQDLEARLAQHVSVTRDLLPTCSGQALVRDPR